MRIALVHDYLSQDGGAERVLKSLHEIWPEAPIFVLFYDAKKINYLDKADIRESTIASLPFAKSVYQWYLPLMPIATEKYDLRDFDVIISSTSAFAKGVITSPETLHISYCHTPPRYLWASSNQYMADLRQNWLVKFALPRMIHKMRIWDKMSADRVDHFVANSKVVQLRIQKYYRRESEIIYPPVDTNKFSINNDPGDYFVAGGRLVPYKRLDLVVKVFNFLKLPLKIFGIGPELERLKSRAKPNIQFLEKISDEEKYNLLSRAKAFIHPQLEDFGITPVETMAAGRPVIAFAGGGALETIIPGETGLFFAEQTWESLLHTVLHFNSEHWDSGKIREQALKFSDEIFKEKIKRSVEDRYEEFKKGLNQEVLLPV